MAGLQPLLQCGLVVPVVGRTAQGVQQLAGEQAPGNDALRRNGAAIEIHRAKHGLESVRQDSLLGPVANQSLPASDLQEFCQVQPVGYTSQVFVADVDRLELGQLA